MGKIRVIRAGTAGNETWDCDTFDIDEGGTLVLYGNNFDDKGRHSTPLVVAYAPNAWLKAEEIS